MSKSSGIEAKIRGLLVDVLGVAPMTVAEMTDETPLFGALPELDSMAVAGLLTEMEDRLNITIDDDDVDGELFETFGSLIAFVRTKIEAKAGA
jgi:acyl carrier protein